MVFLSSIGKQKIRERAPAIWEAEGPPKGKHAEHWRMALSEFEGEKAPNIAEVVGSPVVTATPGAVPKLRKKSSRSA